MLVPRVSHMLDYEGELTLIIGKGGRYIDEADALSHVAGYACYNEGSIRDWQRHTHQFAPGKNFPFTGGFGPWMVTADEIPDPTKLELTTRLNGEVMQHATTEDMEDHVQRQYLALLPPFGTKDFREGPASYLEKRPPVFRRESTPSPAGRHRYRGQS